MQFTQVQINEIIQKVVSDEEGLNAILKMSLEALMKSERSEHNQAQGDLSNGFRSRRVFGDKQMLELQVPRTRHQSFYPIILALLKNQEQEAKTIAFRLYTAGLTTEQVGEVFEDIYGKHYSTSQVSRMFEGARGEVQLWLSRSLDSYFPILYIDATFIYTRRGDNVTKEAYYTILGVKSDRTREVLGVYNSPTEGSGMWDGIFEDLKKRGLQEVGLIVSDGLTGIENAIWKAFKGTEIQLCVIHLFRVVLRQVKPADKSQIAEELKEVFRVDDRDDSIEKAKERYQKFGKKWQKTYPSILKRYENERFNLYFTYLKYDYRIRNMIYSTNWVERLNRDYKRTTRMRGSLPNAEATILLLSGVSMTRKAYLRKVPKLDYEREKFKWDEAF